MMRRIILALSTLSFASGCHQSIELLPPAGDLPSGTSPIGWYDVAKGYQVFVTEGPTGGLRLLDFDSARFVALSRSPDSTYKWKPSDSAIPRRVTFARDAAGKITALDWIDSSGARALLRRAVSYPFDHKLVHFESSDSVVLAGTVLIPQINKFVGKTGGTLREVPMRLPAAVIVHGSGASDRDNVWAYQFAAHLARNGFVVLIPDKRGSGGSGGKWQTAGFDVLTQDALAGIDFLKRDARVDPARAGVVGLSQGGWIAPLAAVRGKLAFAVDVSGAAVTPYEQFVHEVTQDFRKAKVGDADMARLITLVKLSQDYTRSRSPDAWTKYIDLRTELSKGPLAPIVAEATTDSASDEMKFWHSIGDFDPNQYWSQLSGIPVLVLYGEADEQDNVPVQASVDMLRRSLTPERNPKHVVRVFPALGHTLFDDKGLVAANARDLLSAFLNKSVVDTH